MTDNYLRSADFVSMSSNGKERVVEVVRRRDGTRELKTRRPLDSMDAAFDALAQLSLG